MINNMQKLGAAQHAVVNDYPQTYPT